MGNSDGHQRAEPPTAYGQILLTLDTCCPEATHRSANLTRSGRDFAPRAGEGSDDPKSLHGSFAPCPLPIESSTRSDPQIWVGQETASAVSAEGLRAERHRDCPDEQGDQPQREAHLGGSLK